MSLGRGRGGRAPDTEHGLTSKPGGMTITTIEKSRTRSFAQGLFAPLGARYDALGEILSVGQNGRWRKAMVDRIVNSDPRNVLDVATGTAGVAMQIARRTGAQVVAIDISPDMMARGRRNVSGNGLDGSVRFAQAQAERLPFRDGVFDALSFTYLLRYVADPAATVSELARVVRPGGTVANLEFYVPQNPLLRAGWEVWMHSVLPAGGLVGGRAWYEVGRFLRPSIVSHYNRYPLEWHVGVWQRAGMVDVGYCVMSLGSGVVMWGTKDG